MNKIIKIIICFFICFFSFFTYKYFNCKKLLQHKHYVIVGASIAGTEVIKNLVNSSKEIKITWISNEKEEPYNRTKLLNVLENKNLDKLKLIDLKNNGINFRNNEELVFLDKVNKCIKLSNGEIINYDYLFLGLGSSPKKINIKGYDSKGVFYLHYLEDINKINNHLAQNKVKDFLIIGAGLNGLELANSIKKLYPEIKISIIDINKNVLSKLVDENASNIIQEEMKKLKIDFYNQALVKEIFSNNKNQVSGILLNNDKYIKADVIVFCLGVKPNIEIAKKAGLKLHSSEGLYVNNFMQTSDPNIYAAGDMIAIKNILNNEIRPSCKSGLARKQAKIAANAMLNEKVKPYKGGLFKFHTSIFGLKIMACGTFTNIPSSYKILEHKTPKTYKKIIIDKNNIIKGIIGINDNCKELNNLIGKQIPIPEKYLKDYFIN